MHYEYFMDDSRPDQSGYMPLLRAETTDEIPAAAWDEIYLIENGQRIARVDRHGNVVERYDD